MSEFKEETKLPHANVKTYSINENHKKECLLEQLPEEVLYLIIEKLDKASLYYCFHVCKRWRRIVFSLANSDKKTKGVRHVLYTQYNLVGDVNLKNHNHMSYKELIESSLNWNYECSISLSMSAPVIGALELNIYKENITVATSKGVTFFDMKTFEIKKKICLSYDFFENDNIVVITLKCDSGDGYTLKLFGKRDIDDCRWETEMTTPNDDNSIYKKVGEVKLHKISHSYVYVLDVKNTLFKYYWNDPETSQDNNFSWQQLIISRYYGTDEALALNAILDDVYLLTSSGGLHRYALKLDINSLRIYNYSGIKQSRFVKFVHVTSLVMSVPDDHPCRITRIRKGQVSLYRLEIPKLTCVAQHGDVLFLGFSDGKVKIVTPMAFSREYIFRHCIDLSDYKAASPAPVVSIQVYADIGKQDIIVATASRIYRFSATFPDTNRIWDRQNMPNVPHVKNAYESDLVEI